MLKILVLISSLASNLAFANQNETQILNALLNQFEEAGINRECTVTFDSGRLAIRGKETRKSVSFPINDVRRLALKVVRAEYLNYDGEGRAYFILDGSRLDVVATWTDRDNGVDQSSFCTLYRKAN